MARGTPDFWGVATVMKGMFNDAFKTLATDINGNLITLIKALSNGELVDLTADANGFLQMNVSGQDLDILQSRPVYGAATGAVGSAAADASSITDLISVTGQGQIYGGFLETQGAGSIIADIPLVLVDGSAFSGLTIGGRDEKHITMPGMDILYDVDFLGSLNHVVLGLMPLITFESSFSISYSEQSGRTPQLFANVVYALV